MFKLMPINEDGVVGMKLTGTLHDADYQAAAPEIEKLLTRVSPVRVLLDWEDFEGWDEEAAAHAFHFRMSHRSDVERVAILGGHRHEENAKKLAEDLGEVEMRLFDIDERDAAMAWLTG